MRNPNGYGSIRKLSGKRKRPYELFMDEFKIERTPHECRHTFATIAAASKLNPILLKKIIGHASADITESIYTHAYIEDLIAEIDKYNL